MLWSHYLRIQEPQLIALAAYVFLMLNPYSNSRFPICRDRIRLALICIHGICLFLNFPSCRRELTLTLNYTVKSSQLQNQCRVAVPQPESRRPSCSGWSLRGKEFVKLIQFYEHRFIWRYVLSSVFPQTIFGIFGSHFCRSFLV
jgi:hypothetical protein